MLRKCCLVYIARGLCFFRCQIKETFNGFEEPSKVAKIGADTEETMEQQSNHWDNTQSQLPRETNAIEILNDWKEWEPEIVENKRYVSEEPLANVDEVMIQSQSWIIKEFKELYYDEKAKEEALREIQYLINPLYKDENMY